MGLGHKNPALSSDRPGIGRGIRGQEGVYFARSSLTIFSIRSSPSFTWFAPIPPRSLRAFSSSASFSGGGNFGQRLPNLGNPTSLLNEFDKLVKGHIRPRPFLPCLLHLGGYGLITLRAMNGTGR